jgi:hypothetical protein
VPPPKASHWGEHGSAEQKQNSTLPIEWFDQAEHEDPTQWAMCTPEAPMQAKSRYLNNGVWEWRSCEVVGYGLGDGMFQIKWPHSGSEKKVRRLNLCFEGDDVGLFEKRGEAAHAIRARAEDAMRLSTFVDGAPAGEMPTMLREQIERILLTIGKDIPHANFDLMSDLVKGVEQDYLRSQSMATLDYLLKDESEAVRMRAMGFLAQTKLAPATSAADDEEEAIAARQASEARFVSTREAVYNVAFCSSPSIVQAMQQVYEDWVVRAGESFLNPEQALAELRLPAHLHDFKVWQEDVRVRLKERLTAEWVRAKIIVLGTWEMQTFTWKIPAVVW